MNFLDSYLRPRQGQVVVEGEFSDEFEIADSVFQGTVLAITAVVQHRLLDALVEAWLRRRLHVGLGVVAWQLDY